MGLPVDDWQFYAVSAVGLLAVWLFIRPWLPSRKSSTGCGSCASGSAAGRKRRISLTVKGDRV